MDFLKIAGVACGVYYPLPIHLQPAYASLGLKKGAFPISEALCEKVLSLPMHPNMTDEHVSEVCATVNRFIPKPDAG